MKTLLFLLLTCVASIAQADLTAKPAGPIKVTVPPKLVPVEKPQVLGPDLAIESANQTSPNFWIVRVKNIGGGKTPPTTVNVVLKFYPPNSGPSVLIGSGSAAVEALESGKLADVNVTTNVNSNATMTANISVNADKTFLETNYGNNYFTKKAGY
nr:CARDB domain-containing protein [Rhodoferax sp.]